MPFLNALIFELSVENVDDIVFFADVHIDDHVPVMLVFSPDTEVFTHDQAFDTAVRSPP
jgi:hypothetical protein